MKFVSRISSSLDALNQSISRVMSAVKFNVQHVAGIAADDFQTVKKAASNAVRAVIAAPFTRKKVN